ncbi:protein REPRESSOR OF SILENCING 3 [Diospyros lotus]|uniref:protein REPRESSOR OF SILENCING 3 n=1 Tax=Diospyros lotus TaxID=55363 RepID=UPI0022563C14|nr:protein REPRESSOR OF SILENCING 3 [Diospyros lotus]
MAGEPEHSRRKEATSSRSTGKNTADNGGEEEEGKGTITRIFVGGLGASVTAEDLRKTFSSLGTVESLEIVRTKGRSFAYFDFLPSSIKSLPKLFSTYNGCMWKGGRLRLEKAREHYLLRLRQDWAEDAKLANSGTDDSVDVSKPVGSPKKLSNGLNLKKTEVRLFFPKLRKVKLLPFNGSGKHKYSFQRVEVPPLPIHFCDCEEHSDPSHSAKEKKISELETQVHGMDEKELNMMESVMKKLFEGEIFLKPDCNATGLIEEGDEAAKSVDQLQDTNAIDHMTDEDNLIMNLVAGGKNLATLLGRQGQETNSPDEGSTVKLPTSKGRASENVLRSQKRKTVPSTKKRKFSLIEETDGIEVLSTNMKKKKKSVNNNHSNESVQPIEVGSVSRQSNTNISWPQKSIGSELAGERDDTSFGTSHIKPGIVPARDESKSDNTSVPYLSDHPNQNLVKSINLESQPSLPNVQKEPAATQSNEPSAALNKSARGASWLQKSSWTQLVGGTNSSFSISQLLQGTTSKRQEQEEPKSEDAMTKTVLVKSSSNGSSRDCANASGVCTGVALTSPHSSKTVGLAVGLDHESRQKGVQTLGKTDATSAQKFEAQRVQPPNRNFAIGETCSFMRSASSMREWTSAKAALSGSLKKKNKEK